MKFRNESDDVSHVMTLPRDRFHKRQCVSTVSATTGGLVNRDIYLGEPIARCTHSQSSEDQYPTVTVNGNHI
jgi:hypothetical protein